LHEYHSFHADSQGFWIFTHKPPGGDNGAARRRTSFNPVFGFYHERPSGRLKSARRYMGLMLFLVAFANCLDM